MAEERVLTEHEAPVKDPTTPQPQQDDEAKEDVKLVLTLFEQGKAARKKYDQNWSTYEQFYKGDQWSNVRSKNRAKPVVNICRVTIQSILPILTDAHPTFNVLPSTPEDYRFAKGLGKITDSWWQKFDVGMDHTLIEVLMDSQVFDAGILKVVWDPDAEEGTGDIRADVINPKDIFIPEGARDFHKDCPWVIQRMRKPVGEVRLQFPDFAKQIKADEDSDKNEIEQNKPINEVTLVSPTDRHTKMDTPMPVSGSDERKLVTVLECWMDDQSLEEYEATEEVEGITKTVKKLKKKYPRGKLITILPNQKIRLQGVENPFKHAKKPYVRFVDAINSREFWGEGEVGPLLDMQKIINKILANILDYMQLMSNPIWKVEKDSGVDPDDITNAYGLILTPDAGKSNSVSREIPPPIQQALFQFYDMMQRTAEMISGASDVTQGRRPTGITAAAAIEGLQEAAQTRIRLKERNMKVSLAQLGYLIVQLIMQYYTEPRIARLGGEDIPEFFEFFMEETPEGTLMHKQNYEYNKEKDDYNRAGEYETTGPTKGIFDVQILSGSTLPFMRGQKINTAFKLQQVGAIDTEALLDAVEWPDKGEIMERMQKQAQEEAAAAEALPPPPER